MRNAPQQHNRQTWREGARLMEVCRARAAHNMHLQSTWHDRGVLRADSAPAAACSKHPWSWLAASLGCRYRDTCGAALRLDPL